jgi:hypothetical protein
MVREEEEGGRLGHEVSWAGWAESEKNSFLNKILFLNIPRLWKFAQGDLGGILT